jgi:hypothetical protein
MKAALSMLAGFTLLLTGCSTMSESDYTARWTEVAKIILG